MATNWTDPTLTTSTRIRATHINELRSVVSQNRSAVGLSTYTWTDTPASTTVHIRAVHFTELRSAIQDLWNHQGMGSLPNWSVGSAPAMSRQVSLRDTNDLRNWIQQYENATGISYQPVDPVVGPFRGMHLSHGGDLRPIDLTALSDFAPGAAVALLSDVYAYTQNNTVNPNLFSWLKNNQTNRELFLRSYPTPCPPCNSLSEKNPSYQYACYNSISSSAQFIKASDAASAIRGQVNALKAAGLTNFRVIVGNEPEIEWDTSGGSQWAPKFWQDVNQYFQDIYSFLSTPASGGLPAEAYPPGFQQFGFVACSSFNPDGTVTRRSVTNPSFTNADNDYGAYYVQNMLDAYNNGTSVGRMIVHSYFWPGYQANHVIDKFLPGFIMSRVSNGMPARVTEFGWWPGAITPGACPTQYCCPANQDSTSTSCDGVRTGINCAGDFNDYMRNQTKLGGYSFWLLADPTNTTPGAVAVDASGNIRSWFTSLISYYNQQ